MSLVGVMPPPSVAAQVCLDEVANRRQQTFQQAAALWRRRRCDGSWRRRIGFIATGVEVTRRRFDTEERVERRVSASLQRAAVASSVFPRSFLFRSDRSRVHQSSQLKKHTNACLLCVWIKALDSPKSGRKQPRTIRETIKEEYSNDNNDNSVSIHESFVFADEKSNL